MEQLNLSGSMSKIVTQNKSYTMNNSYSNRKQLVMSIEYRLLCRFMSLCLLNTLLKLFQIDGCTLKLRFPSHSSIFCYLRSLRLRLSCKTCIRG